MAPTEKEFKMGGLVPPLKTLLKRQESKVHDVDDFESLLNKNKPPEPEPEPEPVKENKVKNVTIIAVVYMSKELVAAESNGKSDPYVQFKFDDRTLQTTVKDNTMNGIWNEKLVFNDVRIDLDDIATWPIFQVTVYDYNKGTNDKPLGYNYLWLCNAAYTMNDIEGREPKWHKLFLPKSNKQQGRLLLSFYMFDEEHKDLIPQVNITQKVSLYSFEFNILGLRQLKPLGMLPVKNLL